MTMRTPLDSFLLVAAALRSLLDPGATRPTAAGLFQS